MCRSVRESSGRDKVSSNEDETRLSERVSFRRDTREGEEEVVVAKGREIKKERTRELDSSNTSLLALLLRTSNSSI